MHMWKPVNRERIGLGAGYERNLGSESVCFVGLFQKDSPGIPAVGFQISSDQEM